MKSDSTQSDLLKPRWSFFAFLIVLTTLLKLTPYILNRLTDSGLDETAYYWNFSAVPALCIFGGAVFRHIQWSYLVPLSAWLIADLGIWIFTGKKDWAFYPAQPFVYLGFAAMVSLGLLLRKNKSIPKIAVAGLGSSVSFFLISNFGIWLMGDGITFPRNIEGLTACYVVALPFFKTSLTAMVIFLPILFSPLALTHLQKEPEAKIALETF